MTNFEKFLETIKYNITEGSEYHWDCFGPNTRYLDSTSSDYTISALFDTTTKVVFVMEAWDYINDRAYRWVNPFHLDVYIDEHKARKLDYTTTPEKKFIDLEEVSDFFDKASAIFNKVEYDTRISVPINLNDDELLVLFKLAHERDITLNELAMQLISEVLNEQQKNNLAS